MIPLRLTKIKLPPDNTQNIVVDLSYKEYYSPNFTLLATNVPVLANGTIQASPAIQFNIDPTKKYIIQSINLLCDGVYEQLVEVFPYCDAGFQLSQDGTFCFMEELATAIPPTNPMVTVARTGPSYNTCGSYIYHPGWLVNGTGPSDIIPLVNTFWRNGGTCVDNNTSDGVMNRAGLWGATTTNNQDIGFSRCITVTEEKTYYIGISCDNYGFIDIDGVNVLTQNETAVNAQYSVTGACFKVFHIYPIVLKAGNHIIEASGHNVSGAAGLAIEIYDNTAVEIAAATSYADLNLVFSTKDFIGMPVQIGSGGSGYSCEEGFALSYCDSPIVCKRTIISNLKY